MDPVIKEILKAMVLSVKVYAYFMIFLSLVSLLKLHLGNKGCIVMTGEQYSFVYLSGQLFSVMAFIGGFIHEIMRSTLAKVK